MWFDIPPGLRCSLFSSRSHPEPALRWRNPAAPVAASAMTRNRFPVRESRHARLMLPHAAPNPRRKNLSAHRGKSGGGSNGFDGAWIVSSVGVTCSGSSNAVVVTSGKIIGQTARGTVRPDGRVYGTSSGNGITVVTVGRLSGRSGGGTFRQSDGCTGRWTAAKQ